MLSMRRGILMRCDVFVFTRSHFISYQICVLFLSKFSNSVFRSEYLQKSLFSPNKSALAEKNGRRWYISSKALK
jgi:hypothetical protein